MQRAAIRARLDLLFGRPRGRQGLLGHHRGVALQGGVHLRNPVQHSLGEIDWGNVARSYQPADLLEAKEVQRLGGASICGAGRRRREAGTCLQRHEGTRTQQRESAAPGHQAVAGSTCVALPGLRVGTDYGMWHECFPLWLHTPALPPLIGCDPR